MSACLIEIADAKDQRPHPNNAPWTAARPKGMHHDTIEQILEDVREAHREWDEAMQAELRRLADRYDIDV